jgi:adenosylcobinamide-GDP ribazoletransferase
VSGLLVAARYLTIVPIGRGRADLDGGALGRAAPWFPVVGLALGLVLAGVDRLAVALFPSLLSALLTITLWKLLTGGLHLDGLADCLDGLQGQDPAQRLRIMRDSRIGAFGAMGLILALLLALATLAELPSWARWRALVVAPAVGRTLPALLACLHPAARPEGQGAGFRAGVGHGGAVLAAGAAGVVAVAVLGAPGVPAVLGALATGLGLGWLLARRLGGVTGDVFGAAVEVTELVVLLVVAGWTTGRP